MGTQGELNAKMNADQIEIFNFLTRKTRTFDFDSAAASEAITGGHGGGDTGIIHALRDLMDGKRSNSVCEIGESCDNHMISFAAEESRITGKVINLTEFERRFD
jgi:hypothetical protein